jgi:DNA-binding FadR family transcriptional regulator
LAKRRFVALAQNLLVAVDRGDYKPGDRLPPDRLLATQEGVSRATVREALLALEILGIVEIRHGSGVYVLGKSMAPSSEELAVTLASSTNALYEARTVIEPEIARLCASRMTPEVVEQLTTSLVQARGIARSESPYPTFVDVQLAFHTRLAAACDSAVLGDIAGRLASVEEHPLWALVNQHVIRTRAQRLEQVAEHTRILNAIRDQDPDAAAAAMRDHLTGLGHVILGKP